MKNENHYAVFLRGVNVGGHGTISMDELKKELSSHEFMNVQSYINSGNLLLSTGLDKMEAGVKIAALIIELFGLKTEVFVKTTEDVQEILDNDPFDLSIIEKESWKIVILLSRDVEQTELNLLNAGQQFEEIFYLHNNILYVYYPHGSGTSKFTINLIDRKLKLKATGRTWKTIKKIRDLLNQDNYRSLP